VNIAQEHDHSPIAAAPRAVAIDVRGVSFAYGERLALDDVSLAVERGTIAGILGPNGSGKSTLLSLLIGRRRVASGEVLVLGEPVSPALRARMAMIFQEPSLDPLMTVSETMHLHGRLFGNSRPHLRGKVDELLGRFGLADRAAAATATLSGGLRRRLELARALLSEPEVLLLDEPSLALDPDSRRTLWQHLLEANAAGATLLLATNDVHEAERYCQTVSFFAHGRVVAEGAPNDLRRGLRRDAVQIDWKSDASAEMPAIDGWAGVGGSRTEGRSAHVTVDNASEFLGRLFREFGASIHNVRIEESTLEDAYFQLAGTGIAQPEIDHARGGG
jgi:ABC-2 type transport system ATP-binding protein